MKKLITILAFVVIVGIFRIAVVIGQVQSKSENVDIEQLFGNIDIELLARAKRSQIIFVGKVLTVDYFEEDGEAKYSSLKKANIEVHNILKGEISNKKLTVFAEVPAFTKGETCIFYVNRLNLNKVKRKIGSINAFHLPSVNIYYLIWEDRGKQKLFMDKEKGYKVKFVMNEEKIIKTKRNVDLSRFALQDKNILKRIKERFKKEFILRGSEEGHLVIQAFREFHDPQDLPFFINIIKDKKIPFSVKIEAVIALNISKSQETIEELKRIITDKTDNMTVRAVAAETLGRIGNKNAIKALIHLPQSPGGPDFVAHAFLQLDNSEAIEPLAKEILERLNKDKDDYTIKDRTIILNAIGALGRNRDKKANPFLMEILMHSKVASKESILRIKIAFALYKCGNVQGKKFLLDSIKESKNRYTKLEAADKLVCIDLTKEEEESIVSIVQRIAQDAVGFEKEFALEILEKLKYRRDLINFLTH